MTGGELCSVCKKRMATVFITQKDSQGNQVNKWLCLVCAKQMGLPQVSQFLDKMGISDEELESLTDEMGSMMEQMQSGMEDQLSEASESGDAQETAGTNTPNIFKMFGNLASMSKMESPESRFQNEKKEGDGEKNSKKAPKYKFLPMYSTDLTEKAANGKIDTIVGRDREIERMIQIVNRRTKNNPVLIGEAGVGKTAIAEGLALRISRKQVPSKLLDKKVFLLDLTAMVAGTQFRGQFEGRMKGLIDEVKKDGNIILVIDEVHNIMGAGEAEGSMNAANILKPALSRGEIQVIGATTLKEYRKYIEKDSALERRFQPVFVNEPSVAETVDILKGIRPHYEEYHKVRISDTIIEDATKMAERYITDRFLPDKAIDVVDEAASRANLRNLVLPKIAELEKEMAAIQQEITDLEGKEPENEDARLESFRKIAEGKSRLAVLEPELNALKEKEYVQLEFDDIAQVIETWTGIPVHTVSADEANRLLSLEQQLKGKVIGQDAAVECVARAIRRNRSGFRKKFKPSSFIFVGPTGVGKTELVKRLTEELFGTQDALIRLDMSEYMEKHTVSKLIGSPPGYVGYDEAGQLTEQVRRRPYSVILLDEIEKAHADVFNMLLQILDDGRLTDSQGRTVNFENTVIVMTSNAGNSLKSKGIGFANDELKAIAESANEALKEIFRPEFLNRVDEVVVFNRLDMDTLVRVAKLMTEEIIQECRDKGIALNIRDEVYVYMAERGADERYGARPLRRLIQKKLEDTLAEGYLRGEYQSGVEICVRISEDDIVLDKQ
ncbi:MAG: ATP-dependent Clp protease ATP-binding subunit [Clostridia bacterium]|nr:ATP-dependent Clp protease ATP-binding subunit [Clostridia bacterium]